MEELQEFNSKEEFIEHLKTIDFEKLSPTAQNELTLFLENERVQEARESFLSFVKLIGPTRLDGFKMGRHIELICEHLQDLSTRIWGNTGDTCRKMISLPPGGMKSELCTRLFPAWLYGVYPHIRIIIIGHGKNFTEDEFGAKIRDIVRSEEYKKIFPRTELRADKQTAGRFLTTQNGEMVCSSLESKIAGRRAHLIVSDDSLVEDDALSKAVRMRLVGNYMPNVRSRLLMTPDCGELLVGTRFCQDDLFDYLEKEDRHSPSPWEIVRIPALLDDAASLLLRRDDDPEGYLEPGTSFWPEFHPTRRLESLRASYSNNLPRWNAVYMQSPTPEEGLLISMDDFKRWNDESPPDYHTIIVTADTAYTKQSYSDYTAFQVWALFKMPVQDPYNPNITLGHKNHAILLNSAKGKFDFPELCQLFTDITLKERPDIILLEDRSSGIGLIPELRKRGLPVIGWKTEKDKFMRMQASAPLVKSGLIYVPYPEGNSPENSKIRNKSNDFMTDISSFPGGNHDDVPDAFSQFILYCRDNNLLMSDGYEFEYDDDEDDDYDDDYGVSYVTPLL